MLFLRKLLPLLAITKKYTMYLFFFFFFFFKRSAKMTCEQLFRLPELFSQVDVKQNNKIMGQEELRNYWV